MDKIKNYANTNTKKIGIAVAIVVAAVFIVICAIALFFYLRPEDVSPEFQDLVDSVNEKLQLSE